MRVLLFLTTVIYFNVLSQPKVIELSFYGQAMRIECDNSIVIQGNFKNNHDDLTKFHNKIQKTNYNGLVSDLLGIRSKYELNDWLYYDLVSRLSTSIFSKDKNKATYLLWFLLGESGFNSRIAFDQKARNVDCFIPVAQPLYGVLRVGDYYCISCNTESGFIFPQYHPYKKGNHFSFSFSYLPNLIDKQNVNRSFVIPGDRSRNDSVEIQIDENLMRIYSKVPKSTLIDKFNIPLSESSMKLVNVLSEVMKNKNDSIRTSMLMKFIVDNIKLAEDNLVFMEPDRWLNAEELLYYKIGDCEDRSALLFNLLRLVVNRPMIVISYPDEEHVNIAINLDIQSEPSIMWKGKGYFICEVTNAVGFIPLGFYAIKNDLKFIVEGEYP
jgi:hypothetical protein